MARIREGRPPRLPPSLPPQDPDRLRQRPPPMDHDAGREHGPLLADNRETQGDAEADQGPVDQRRAKALQRAGRAGERHHCRLFAQGEEPRRCEAEEAGKAQVYTPGVMSDGFRRDTETRDGGTQHSLVRSVGIKVGCGHGLTARIGWDGIPTLHCGHVIA